MELSSSLVRDDFYRQHYATHPVHRAHLLAHAQPHCVPLTSCQSGYAEAAKLQTLEPHADAAEPACQHFGTCGGCTLQVGGQPPWVLWSCPLCT